ncbi:MAG: hypothetical protein IPQ07_44925 [Myxococcales bacterium]|nr:hypothetical protein [Myxococcales bacterium]
MLDGIAFELRMTGTTPLGVWTFHRLTVMAPATLQFTGTRSAVFVVGTTVTIAGTISGPGGCSNQASCAGPGAGTGGSTVAATGCGAGGPGVADTDVNDGGGGGGGGRGMGGVGGLGGSALALGGTSGAACIAPTLEPLVGGSGGGTGGPGVVTRCRGGGGGGALQITALEGISVSGTIRMTGAGAKAAVRTPRPSTAARVRWWWRRRILLEANQVALTATAAPSVNGGGGGGGASYDVAGFAGADGTLTTTPATGGLGGGTTAGAGGAGAAGTSAASAGVSNANGGGGGGAAGAITRPHRGEWIHDGRRRDPGRWRGCAAHAVTVRFRTGVAGTRSFPFLCPGFRTNLGQSALQSRCARVRPSFGQPRTPPARSHHLPQHLPLEHSGVAVREDAVRHVRVVHAQVIKRSVPWPSRRHASRESRLRDPGVQP